MPEPVKCPVFYKSPPVVERVATVYADVQEELFESRFDEWRSLVEAEYPVYEPLKEWLLHVEEKEGIPLLKTAQPELRITPRFSRKPSQDGFDWSIRCPRGQFTMNMHSEVGKGQERRHANLRTEYARWLPVWIKIFEVKKAARLVVIYVNKLNHESVPSFYTTAGHLQLDQLLTNFSSIPGRQEFIVPPYRCTANVKLHGEPKTVMGIEVQDVVNAHGAAIQVNFSCAIDILNEPVSEDSFLTLMDKAHEHIIDRFEAVFTEKAKNSFDPVF